MTLNNMKNYLSSFAFRTPKPITYTDGTSNNMFEVALNSNNKKYIYNETIQIGISGTAVEPTDYSITPPRTASPLLLLGPIVATHI